MKRLSEKMREAFNINECVVASKLLDTSGTNKKYVAIKHRDRNYKPIISIVHTVLNNMEIVYLRDETTLWSEGMNAAGIVIINSALSVIDDENQEDLVRDTHTSAKAVKDSERILKALQCNDISDAVFYLTNYKGGVNGHTLVTNGSSTHIIEKTTKHEPARTEYKNTDNLVRTNHGFLYTDAGYQKGQNKKSSVSREKLATEILSNHKDGEDILKSLRDYDSGDVTMNPLRKYVDDDSLFTSTQLLLDPTNLEFKCVLIQDSIAEYRGIINQIPNDFETTIKIIVEKN